VSLTVTSPADADTETKTDYIHATAPTEPTAPVADFMGQPTSGSAPLAVQFTDQSAGDVTNWLWSFGDGQTSAQQNPLHIYQAAGDYTVSLTVTGRGGSDAETKAKYIHVTRPKAYPTIAMALTRSFFGRKHITATVTIRANGPEGLPIQGLIVLGHWSIDPGSSVSGVTDTNGKITFTKALATSPKTVTFTVDKVTKDSQQYNLIGQTSKSIDL